MTKLATRPRGSPTSIAEPVDPWTRMERLFEDLRDDLFTSFWPAPFRYTSSEGGSGYLRARADVEDKGSAYEIRADLPGVPKENIQVKLQGNVVQISAENHSEQKEEGRNYLWRERTYEGFQRAFELPEPLVTDKVDARYENGVLTVTIPKAHPAEEKVVPVH
jgi:HSP20 family protein